MKKTESAYLKQEMIDRICAALVAKLEERFSPTMTSKQAVAGSNPVSRSIFFPRLH